MRLNMPLLHYFTTPLSVIDLQIDRAVCKCVRGQRLLNVCIYYHLAKTILIVPQVLHLYINKREIKACEGTCNQRLNVSIIASAMISEYFFNAHWRICNRRLAYSLASRAVKWNTEG